VANSWPPPDPAAVAGCANGLDEHPGKVPNTRAAARISLITRFNG
jgi:hypothetical protein